MESNAVLLNYARAYLRRGWSVVPINPRDKRPAIDWKEYQTRQPTDAELVRWFGGSNADRNIALVTGSISGIVVVDADGPEGIQEVNRLRLHSTVSALTGKGRHLLYKHPGKLLGNTVRSLPGIDTRCDGGYVLVEPSIHPSGKRYRWQGPFTAALPALPSIFLEAAKELGKPQNAPGWIAEALDGLGEGNRNNTFARLVGRLHRDAWQPADIEAFLAPHAASVGFPLDELQSVVASITARPSNKPSTVLHMTKTIESLLNGVAMDWLMPGVLAKDSLMFIAGLPGIGKSIVLLDLALRATVGEACTLGQFKKPLKVLYCDKENGESLMGDRIKLMLATRAVDAARIEFSFDSKLSLTQNEGFRRLESLLESFQPDLVCLDSFVQFIEGADESSSVGMNSAIMKIRDLQRKFSFAVVALHHEHKGVYSAEVSNEQPNAGQMRGSGAIAGAADTVFTLRVREGHLLVFQTKARLGPLVSNRVFALQPGLTFKEVV